MNDNLSDLTKCNICGSEYKAELCSQQGVDNPVPVGLMIKNPPWISVIVESGGPKPHFHYDMWDGLMTGVRRHFRELQIWDYTINSDEILKIRESQRSTSMFRTALSYPFLTEKEKKRIIATMRSQTDQTSLDTLAELQKKLAPEDDPDRDLYEMLTISYRLRGPK